MIKEKYINKNIDSNVTICENTISCFNKINAENYSYRVYEKGMVGIFYHQGNDIKEQGYANAEKKLILRRSYPFELEKGIRHRDKSESPLSDKQLIETANELLHFFANFYPQFTFSGTIGTHIWKEGIINTKGMDYSCKDANSYIDLKFKHKDSKNLQDGRIFFTQRTFHNNLFYNVCNNILQNFTKQLTMSEYCLIVDSYHQYTSFLEYSLSLEQILTGKSLLSNKLHKKVFSEKLTVFHDVSDENCWMNTFWDGDGVVNEKDKIIYINKGKLLHGSCGKRIAQKYGYKTTGNEGINYMDIPSGSYNTMNIKSENKTIKELLNGRVGIIPIQAEGGGFSSDGSYVMPVQTGLLTDGDKILGQVPPFSIISNLFDMFGESFIGVSKFDTNIFNNKALIFECKFGNI